MLGIYKKLLDLLTPRERRRALLLLAMVLITGLVDVLGVASIMPFMTVLSNPEVIQSNTYLAQLFRYGNFSDQNGFLIALGCAVFLILVGSLTFRAVTLWAQLRFSYMRNHEIGSRIVEGYLRQPYEWFLNRHSADLATNILSEVNIVVHHALFPAIEFIAQSTVAVLLLCLLLVVDPTLAMAIAVTLGAAYGIVFLLVRKAMNKTGAVRLAANRQRFQAVHEAFGGIKAVKVGGLEATFLARFRRPSEQLARKEVTAKMITELPSFAMQAVVFGGMMLVILYLLVAKGGLQEALPILALYGFAGYRLMPALQSIYRELGQMRYAAPALTALHKDIAALEKRNESQGWNEAAAEQSNSTVLVDGIELRGIEYTYPGAARASLNGLSLRIPALSRVGIVGPTGSGKTTTVDVLLGLLRPSAGDLLVDGQRVFVQGLSRWQKTLGYVPQSIYLADDTIAANIAFGVPSEKIDGAAVQRAAQVANLHDFVIRDLPEGYDTRVGERGVRLSGGQLQRIGIARALYHDPDVLILDEATSALDNLTEQAVMEAVENLGGRKTIVMIAHRLSTVRECDQIYLMQDGMITASGTYGELLRTSEAFRAMAMSA